MITDEKEYEVTKAELEKFEQALAHLDQHSAEDRQVPDWVQKAQADGMRSMVAELKEAIADYETKRSKLRVLDKAPRAIYSPRRRVSRSR